MNMKTSLSITVLIVFNYIFISTAQPENYKLELVQVLFRHGDRAPQEDEIYKTDPYKQIFKDIGFGQLTKNGMRREHKLGQMLRQRYNTFLGEFKNDDVYGYSTDFDRTKMSLQLVLAGLYPPSLKTSWSTDIRWSPIPTHYNPSTTNFLTTNEGCSRFDQLLENAGKTPEIQKKLEKYNDFMEYLRNKTGMADLEPLSAFKIYNNVRAALSMDLPLPDWCTEEDYIKLRNLTIISHEVLTNTPLMTRITAGSTVDRFLKNIDNNERRINKQKIYLYSGHDINLAMFSNAHKLTGIPGNPDYGSALIIEKLRGRDDQVYLRMVLWTGASEQLIPVKITNCRNECPLSYYKSWVTPILPDDEVRQCVTVDPRGEHILNDH